MKTLIFTFRWPIKQTSPETVEMAIPRGPNGMPIINPDFVAECKLSDGETEAAETAVIREVAIVK